MPTEERSLAGDVADPSTEPSPFGTPNPEPGNQPVEPPVVSIIDTILQLDDYLSGDVRRAEKTARFCSKPWLEADIDQLVFELQGLTDDEGFPLPGQKQAVHNKAVEIQTKQAEMGAAFVSVRMAQLPSDAWQAWRTKWREVLDKGAPYPNDFYDDLIGESALRPPISAVESAALRKKLGDPQMDTLAQTAWVVNTESGVSIPKSPLSSLVLRREERSKS